jgi:phytoene dehydrogenase-like protein
MAEKFDFVFVGAGHNGLTAACYLAKAGQTRRWLLYGRKA